MQKSKYKRILLKFSGEVLMGDMPFGLDGDTLKKFASELKSVNELGVQIGVVIGGGNFFRGIHQPESIKLPRIVGDQIGMLATVMNGLVLVEAIKTEGANAELLSAMEVSVLAPLFNREKAREILNSGKMLILTGGTGYPFFTTDTGAALRAAEISAEIILKGTKVDGVYENDPVKDTKAKKFTSISYQKVIERKLKVMDLTAISFCMENKIPIRVFNIRTPGNLKKAVLGEDIGTLIS